MRVLGINAIFHDPAAALVVDGQVVAAAEEERFSRRKHGKRPVPFAAWEQPVLSARWCLEQAGLTPADVDAVGFSYDPDLTLPAEEMGLFDPWDHLRTTYAHEAPSFLADSLPGLDPGRVRFVPHHVAHAASAGLAAPARSSAVLVSDGRGERHSHLSGHYRDGDLEVHSTQELPHSLGLLYEDLTEYLGFLRSSDEYKVMALASYGKPRHLDLLRSKIRVTGDGGFVTEPVDWGELAPPPGDAPWGDAHADLAASVQRRLEEVLIELAFDLHERTGESMLTMAGGTALNCVANSVLAREGPFEQVWVQPAAGDAGTALGAGLHVAHALDEPAWFMTGADLGRGFADEEIEAMLRTARVPYERPADVAEAVAEVLAADGIVAWFQGRSEFGPRALGHRSLLAHPGRRANLDRMNDVKGRESFRPVAPMVRLDRAEEIFTRGPNPSPYMLFVHDVAPAWQDRIPAVVHVDGTARVQTVDPAHEPLVARMLDAFERRTDLPVVVNTSLNTAGRPMVDDVRDALECFGSSPVDLLAIGPFTVRRP
ncbi:Decarbamoylnovobiocin carbamoyltransferase [Actinomadura rubteroloni]|uniref:Decarbamoylnovobiocin carbamoyltransferase n=1 Tax=Actinomadura rubteroloni TaxID=1926885 RepID=A0A2P4UFQ8_9ACTN|nr:carbamoyltransferase C-terminal domain-containing protein [Actinomadura rubteroloni]POM23848.1 Decarbamoylnovobiocin carbamoyltransferase [Actinomadura rubteroloni]